VVRTVSAVIALGLAVAACADDTIQSDEPAVTGRTAEALDADATVTDAVAQSCSTTAVKGLATQLVEEIQCLRPGTMTRIDNIEGLNLGEAVFPYLQTPAAEALTTAQKVRDVPIAINSGLRTLPQQFLLYRWYKTGRCGIGLAATPGTSNHESAIAVDVQDNAAWRTALQGKGFRWLGASDPVHYDFTGKGAVDIRGLSVQAFQRLWNRNHPEDKIGEDGKYGDDTEKRLARAPAGGFAIGAKCDVAPKTTAPTPEMGDVPASPDADEKDTSEEDEDTPIRQRARMADAGCNMHGSGGGEWALLLALGAVMTAARRRGR
jgi:hypothetical protein